MTLGPAGVMRYAIAASLQSRVSAGQPDAARGTEGDRDG
jgi:hypothetical protein